MGKGIPARENSMGRSLKNETECFLVEQKKGSGQRVGGMPPERDDLCSEEVILFFNCGGGYMNLHM